MQQSKLDLEYIGREQ